VFKSQAHITRKLKLNGERISRDYIAIISSKETIANKTSATKMAWEFSLEYFGMDEEGKLHYTLTTRRRFFLDDRNTIIKKLNKAQSIALQVASINDELKLIVSKSYKLLQVKNTQDIRNKWAEIKSDLLPIYPDLKEMAADFDWQLQEKEIQSLFINDTFYNFMFANIYYKEFEGDSAISEFKLLSNALGSIDVPIKEETRITKQDIVFTEAKLEITGELDIEAATFPLAKMNAFLGKLPSEPGSQHNLDFNYRGSYELRPEVGLIISGELTYKMSIKELYAKETTITLKLEDHG